MYKDEPVAEDEDKLVTEDEDELVTEDKDEVNPWLKISLDIISNRYFLFLLIVFCSGDIDIGFITK